mmetsp:Transcript_30939/g.74666  ORF Transcript_30939/g.74666 Transcript_30939/m.74666 type:complete len:337 (-) Transcript_30939:803-1813(-)
MSGQAHGDGNEGKGSWGTYNSVFAKRKREERARAEKIRSRLDTIVTELYPDRPCKKGANKSIRKTVDVEALLKDTIRVVKEAMTRAGLPIPDTKSREGTIKRTRGKVLTKRMREDRMKGAACTKMDATSSSQPHMVVMEPEIMRGAMLVSTTMGVLLVRTQDMMVVESSSALTLFCAGLPEGQLMGYRGQQLSMMAYWSDAKAVSGLQKQALQGTLQKGSAVACRFLRLNQEPRSKCLAASWTRVKLEVCHVASDGASMLLTFNMAPEHERPLEISDEFWKSYYAPGTGVQDAVSGLYEWDAKGEEKCSVHDESGHTGTEVPSVSGTTSGAHDCLC